jgi:tetratricopeptide (TPR) repeat protein
MTQDEQHWSLETEAMELWGAGRLAEARTKFEAAIALCPAAHSKLGMYRWGYAGVLAELGCDAEAGTQLELALEHELAEAGGEHSPGVAVARCFVGDHYVKVGDYQRALDVIAPSLPATGKANSLLKRVEAHALAGLGREVEAQVAAAAALAAAASDEQRDRLANDLSQILRSEP